MTDSGMNLDQFRKITVDLIRDDTIDLSARQLAIFLICYLDPAPQSMRSLIERLEVSGSVITRAIARMMEYGLITSIINHTDRRSRYVKQTAGGKIYMRRIMTIVQAASVEPIPTTKPKIGLSGKHITKSSGRETSRVKSSAI